MQTLAIDIVPRHLFGEYRLVFDNSDREAEPLTFTDEDSDEILFSIREQLANPLEEYLENEPVARVLDEFQPDENP